jgi:hypothetical protein
MTERYTEHERVREWAEQNDARPCGMVDTEGDVLGVHLCLRGRESDIPMGEGMSLEDISWDDFFDVFERQQLELRVQDDGVQLPQRDRHAA